MRKGGWGWVLWACLVTHTDVTSLYLTVSMASLETKTKTQFDLVPDSITNLAMGAPSDAMLAKCTEVMKTAVKHRMVRGQQRSQCH